MAVVQIQYDPEQQQAALSGQGPLYPEGWYVLQIKSFEQKPGKEGKYPSIECKCDILDSFNKASLGKQVTRRFNMHPKSTPWGLLPFLRAAGIPFQDHGQGAVTFDDALLIGATTKVNCKHKDGDSRKFEEWRDDEPVGNNARPQQGFVQQPAQMPMMQQPPQMQQPQQGWQPQPGGQFQQPMQQPMQMPQQQPQYPQQGFQQQPMQQPQGFPQQQPQQGFPQAAPVQPMQPNFAPPQQQPQNGQNSQNGGYQQQPAPAGWPQGAWAPQQGR